MSRFGLVLLGVAMAAIPPAWGQSKETAATSLCPEKAAAFTPQLADASLSERLVEAGRSRILVVAYEGCRIELLDGCTMPGEYRFTQVNRSRLIDYVLNRRDLFSKLPLDAIALEPALAKGSVMSLRQAMVGFYEAPTEGAGPDRLKGDCRGATHVVGKLDMGAFVLETKTVSGGAPKVTELRKAGVLERCLLGSTDAESEACKAVLKLYLVPVSGKSAMPVSAPHPLLNQLPGPARARRLEVANFGKSIALPEPGKGTVILFWSPSTPASIEALGGLETLVRGLGENRVQAIGLAVDTNDLAARNAVSGLSVAFPLAIDDGSLKRRYQTSGRWPELFVIDQTGRVRYYANGDRVKTSEAEAVVRSLWPD